MNRMQALRLAALRVLAGRVKAADVEARADAVSAGEPGDRTVAAWRGQRVGTVSITAGRCSARVADEDTLVRWVADRYPTEVETVTRVRPAFLQAVLAASKNFGEPAAPDGTLDVPGVQVSIGEPAVSVRLAEDADQVVADMHAAGVLGLDGEVREIPGSDAA